MNQDQAPRLFVGIFPAGISYADRHREKDGDYARCAFLYFGTLGLEWARDCPEELRAEIAPHAAAIKAKRGEPFEVSTAGQTVTLGYMLDEAERREAECMAKPPRLIDEEQFREWLECLPPCRWHHCRGVELFHVSERITGNVVHWCAQLGDRFVCFEDLATAPSEELARKVFEFLRTPEPAQA